MRFASVTRELPHAWQLGCIGKRHGGICLLPQGIESPLARERLQPLQVLFVARKERMRGIRVVRSDEFVQLCPLDLELGELSREIGREIAFGARTCNRVRLCWRSP
jgi:hypothetical protein